MLAALHPQSVRSSGTERTATRGGRSRVLLSAKSPNPFVLECRSSGPPWTSGQRDLARSPARRPVPTMSRPPPAIAVVDDETASSLDAKPRAVPHEPSVGNATPVNQHVANCRQLHQAGPDFIGHAARGGTSREGWHLGPANCPSRRGYAAASPAVRSPATPSPPTTAPKTRNLPVHPVPTGFPRRFFAFHPVPTGLSRRFFANHPVPTGSEPKNLPTKPVGTGHFRRNLHFHTQTPRPSLSRPQSRDPLVLRHRPIRE